MLSICPRSLSRIHFLRQLYNTYPTLSEESAEDLQHVMLKRYLSVHGFSWDTRRVKSFPQCLNQALKDQFESEQCKIARLIYVSKTRYLCPNGFEGFLVKALQSEAKRSLSSFENHLTQACERNLSYLYDYSSKADETLFWRDTIVPYVQMFNLPELDALGFEDLRRMNNFAIDLKPIPFGVRNDAVGNFLFLLEYLLLDTGSDIVTRHLQAKFNEVFNRDDLAIPKDPSRGPFLVSGLLDYLTHGHVWFSYPASSRFNNIYAWQRTCPYWLRFTKHASWHFDICNSNTTKGCESYCKIMNTFNKDKEMVVFIQALSLDKWHPFFLFQRSQGCYIRP